MGNVVSSSHDVASTGPWERSSQVPSAHVPPPPPAPPSSWKWQRAHPPEAGLHGVVWDSVQLKVGVWVLGGVPWSVAGPRAGAAGRRVPLGSARARPWRLGAGFVRRWLRSAGRLGLPSAGLVPPRSQPCQRVELCSRFAGGRGSRTDLVLVRWLTAAGTSSG